MKIHVVLDDAVINHGDALLELHAWVERSTMGCPTWPKLTSQLSLYIEFAAGGTFYDPNDHMGRGELSSIGNWRSTLVISMSLNFTVLATLGEKRDFLKAPLDLRLTWYLVFGSGKPFRGLEEVSVLAFDARTLFP